MGSCCSTSSDRDNLEREMHADSHANNEIGRYMAKGKKVDANVMKLLLLGVGGSGKSTLFKQIEQIHGNGFDQSYVEANVIYIRDNCVVGILKLLEQSENLKSKYNYNTSIDLNASGVVDAIKIIANKDDHDIDDDDDNDNDNKQSNNNTDVDGSNLKQIGDAIKLLWNLNGIKSTFHHRQLFCLYENIDYFFNKISEIYSVVYSPSTEDLLKTRIRTTGIIEKRYIIKNKPFHIFDVGGQRNERKKWISLFDGVDGLIFVAALSHYASVLFEDEQKNSMLESLEVFYDIVNLKYFDKSQIILFLNKEDIFIDRLKDKISLNDCFGDEWNGPNYADDPIDSNMSDDEWFNYCYNESIKYIRDEFYSKSKKPQTTNNQIFYHVTSAISQNNVEKVFNDITKSMIQKNLTKIGIID